MEQRAKAQVHERLPKLSKFFVGAPDESLFYSATGTTTFGDQQRDNGTSPISPEGRTDPTAHMPITLEYDARPIPIDKFKRALLFYVNGKKYEVSNAQPTTTLLEWLRANGLTGTKLGCSEGGCGACTVMISKRDLGSGEIRHFAANACLMPLCAADWCAVTTVEGIGSNKPNSKLHPVQERMTALHGSQCGFCTPGIVMSIYTLLRTSPSLSMAEMQEHLDGNLCRCTGYRPILDAAKSLCADAGACGAAACGGADGGGCCAGGGCAGGGCATDVSDGAEKTPAPTAEQPADPSGTLVEGGDVVTTTSDKLRHFGERYHESAAAAAEPPFPEELAASSGPPALYVSTSTHTWWRPTSLSELLQLKAALPDARLVVGSTEVTIERRYKGHPAACFLSAAAIPELHACTDTAEEMVIGACLPLSDVEGLCKRAAAARPGCAGEACRAIGDMLRWFASTQIRNVACLGGNLATASPISDMIPLLVASGASLTIASVARGSRVAPLATFFTGYRKVDLAADELIVDVRVPHTQGSVTFLRPIKQARRREDDISIVTGGLRVTLEPTGREPTGREPTGREPTGREPHGAYWPGGAWVVTDATLAFGGLGPTVVTAKNAAAALVGKSWSEASVDAACVAMLDELRVPAAAPGGQPEFRGALATSALFKFFVATSIDLAQVAKTSEPPPPLISAAERSAGRSWLSEPKPTVEGTQRYPHASYPGLEMDKRAEVATHGMTPPTPTEAHEATEAAKAGGVRVVGQSLPHASGARHTTGEAHYTDDTPLPPGTLHGWLVRAAKAPATLEAIDASEAKAAPGVEAVLLAADLPTGGNNKMGPLKQDEWCFAEDLVEHVGQVIGIVVARSVEEARLASSLVKVTYGAPPEGVTPCYTIAEAIKCGSYWDDKLGFDSRHDVTSGPPVETALSDPGITKVEGEFFTGGQEHFYLEPQTSLVQPSDDGGLSVLSSSQDPFTIQKYCAKVCGLPLNKVVSKVRRLGGGFGGKETRAAFAAACAAAAAHTLQRPVSLTMRRDVDMSVTGGRHPFYAKYTAAAKRDPTTGEPKLCAIDVQLYSNGGAMLDVSSAVMDRALTHIDNCYKWPSFRARGVVCKTHTPPNTAFRGFGAPQGMLICEHILEHLASAMGVSSDTLRVANLYKPGDEVPFGEILAADEWRVPRAMAELRASADVEARQASVADFNRANKWRKRGLAFVPTKYGIAFGPRFMNQGGALVHIYTDGTILITHGGTEMGQGLHTKVCQVAARALGVPMSVCHVAETASDKVPNAITTAGSMSTELYGMAVLDACRQLVHRLQPLREKLGPDASLAQLATAAWFSRVDLCAHGYFSLDGRRCGFDFNVKPGVKPDGTPDQTTRGNLHNYYTQGVGCVEVEIDVLTGDHEVLRADMLVDLGSSINPALDVGQIEGGFTQGMGWTTMEELVWGDEQHEWVQPGGRLHTAGPGTYKIPAFNDTPRQLNVQLMSGVDNKVAIHSSKAVGEPPFFIGAVVFIAIRNAVAAARKDHLTADGGEGGAGDAESNALPHVSLYSPATSERIRMACGDRFAARAIGDEEANRKDALIVKGSF